MIPYERGCYYCIIRLTETEVVVRQFHCLKQWCGASRPRGVPPRDTPLVYRSGARKITIPASVLVAVCSTIRLVVAIFLARNLVVKAYHIVRPDGTKEVGCEVSAVAPKKDSA